MPFSSSGSTGSVSAAPRTSSSVASPISTSFGAAACCRRAATLTASPVASRSVGAGDDLARVDTDAPLDAELRERLPHLHRRAAGAEGVVLVYGRHAEDGHDRVADELLDRAAVALDDRLHALEVPSEQRLHRLGISRLAERRRSDDVAEEHGDDLPMHTAIIARRRSLD